jgi:hypothetical protein
MQKFPRLAVAAVTFLLLPVTAGLAQNAPSTGAGTATAPAATTAPDATTTPPAATTSSEPAKTPKKKAAKKMTRQQEIDKSIDNGTVPARYRSSVPKEYQQYIPFDKR